MRHMLTDIRSRALLALSLGFVPVGSSLHGQAATPAPERVTDGTIRLSYRLQALKRNKQGQYEMTGTLRGERRGEAMVEFGFNEGSSDVPGHAPVHAYWVVRAVPDSESFKARLRGTADLVSGQTHLVGTITDGAGKGQRVATNSRLVVGRGLAGSPMAAPVRNFGPDGVLSDVDGNMVIGGERSAKAAPDTMARQEH